MVYIESFEKSDLHFITKGRITDQFRENNSYRIIIRYFMIFTEGISIKFNMRYLFFMNIKVKQTFKSTTPPSKGEKTYSNLFAYNTTFN